MALAERKKVAQGKMSTLFYPIHNYLLINKLTELSTITACCSPAKA